MLPKKGAAKAFPGANRPRGSFLIETTISLFVLVAVAIVLLDGSMNILKPRVWVMKTNLVDAYLSQEIATMNSVGMDQIKAGTSGWGSGSSSTAASANAVTVNNVVAGKMPGFTAGTGNGRDYTVTVKRIRIIPEIDGTTITNVSTAPNFDTSSGALALADMGINCYELQTHVTYVISGKTYVKTRSLIRTE